MDEQETIQVLVVEPRQPPSTGRDALPRPTALAQHVVDVPIAALRESVGKVTSQVGEIARDLPNSEGPVRLDEISVGLSVSASGEVRWIAVLGVEVGSTLTLTFKVADASAKGAP